MLAIAYTVVVLRWARGLKLEVPLEVLDGLIERLPKFDRDMAVVASVQLLQIGLWFTREGSWGWQDRLIENRDRPLWGDGAVAIVAAFPLFILESVQRPGEALLSGAMLTQLNWSVVLLLGAGFSIAFGVQQSGLDTVLADLLVDAHSGPSGISLPVFLGILIFAVSTFTEFASNTATANVVLPVLAVTAVELDYSPLVFLYPAVAACSCAFCFPMATPPNAIVFSSKRVSFSEMFSTGVFINLLTVVVLPVVFMAFSFPVGGLGGWFGNAGAPRWAKRAIEAAQSGAKLVNCTFTSPAPTPEL